MSESQKSIAGITTDGSTIESDSSVEPNAAVAGGLPLDPVPGPADAESEGAVAQAHPSPPSISPEPANAAEPVDPEVAPDPVIAVLERFEDRLEESQRLLARQSEIATSLHAENQRLKAGELRGALLPIARDVIRVRDVLLQIFDTECADVAGEQRTQHPLYVAVESLHDALERNGIEVMPVTAGTDLDPRRHKVVAVAAVDDAAAHRTIAEVVKVGFVWEDGAPIRPAEVRVNKHVPPAQPDLAPDAAAEA